MRHLVFQEASEHKIASLRAQDCLGMLHTCSLECWDLYGFIRLMPGPCRQLLINEVRSILCTGQSHGSRYHTLTGPGCIANTHICILHGIKWYIHIDNPAHKHIFIRGSSLCHGRPRPSLAWVNLWARCTRAFMYISWCSRIQAHIINCCAGRLQIIWPAIFVSLRLASNFNGGLEFYQNHINISK